jgi:hypothetical protein
MAKRQNRPGKRESDRLFQIGSFWLGQEAGSDYFFYYWYDEATRRTRRKTTGCRDLEEAKTFLAKLSLAEPPDKPEHPENVTLATVRKFYFDHHARKIRSAHVAKRAFALMTVYLNNQNKAAGIEGAPKVGHLTLAIQEGFMRWCRDKHKLSAKSISIYLSAIKAGVRFASKPRLVTDGKGREREVTVLILPPHIVDGQEHICKVTDLPRSKPRGEFWTDDEMARFIDQIQHEHVFRWLLIELNTGARPEAVFQLSVNTQVDFEKGLVHLNPPGRRQNNKVRPTIPLTGNLRGWLLYWNLDKPILYNGRPCPFISNRTLQKVAKRASVDKPFTKYTVRHFMATRIRRVEGIHVEREERAAWMGHVDHDYRVTEEWYEAHDPDYLVNVARAIDAIMQKLNAMCGKSLFSPNARPSSGLVLLKSQNNS